MSERVYNVLFVCAGNSARSAFGEMLVNRWGAGNFVGHSAGSAPSDEVHPLALKLLTEQGHDVSGLHTKSWLKYSHDEAEAMDFVFTVCDDAAAESCPTWPGEPITAHWSIPDPAKASGSPAEQMIAFREAYAMLEMRVKLFLSLPLAKLDRIAIHHEVTKIGQLAHAA